MNIMVLGCSGGGKSTTAAKLAEIFDLRAIHLDLYLWKAGWVQRDTEDIQALLLPEIEKDGWVTDGNHSNGCYAERLEKTDMLVWVDMPRWRCMLNIFLRVWKYRGKTRPSMTEGCPERFDWEFAVYVWNFKHNKGKRLAELFEQVKHEKRLYRLKNYDELNQFLSEMTRESDFQQKT